LNAIVVAGSSLRVMDRLHGQVPGDRPPYTVEGWFIDLTDDERRKLAVAAQSNNTDAVRLMLKAGWPVDVRDQQGATPLHWAAWHGNAEMTRALLRYTPPLEAADDQYHAKPLGWAIHGSLHGWHRTSGDYGATVDALLQAGAVHPTVADDFEGSDAVRDVLRRWT